MASLFASLTTIIPQSNATATVDTKPRRRIRRVSCPNVYDHVNIKTSIHRSVAITRVHSHSNNVPSLNTETTDPQTNSAVVSALNTKISTLERTIEEMQSSHYAVQSKCNVYAMENEILRESLAKSAVKCAEYDKLCEQHEDVKADLLSAMTTSKLLLDQNRELDSQKDALSAKCQQIEEENIAYQREITVLREIEQSLNENLISLNRALKDKDSQPELGTVTEEYKVNDDAEEQLEVMHVFKDEISKLHLKIEDLNRDNHALTRWSEDIGKDNVDGMVRKIPPSHTPSRRGSITSLPSMSMSNLYQFCRKMSVCAPDDACSETSRCEMNEFKDDYDIPRHIVGEVSEVLWSEIENQVIKMESLLPESVDKSIGYDDDIDDLPRRLQGIYTKMDDEMMSVRGELQEFSSLKKIHEQCVQERDVMQNTIKAKNEMIRRLLSDAEGYKVQLAGIMDTQNKSDQRIRLSLQKTIDALKAELIDYDHLKRDAMMFETMREEYEALQREHVQQSMQMEIDREAGLNMIGRQQQYIKELKSKEEFYQVHELGGSLMERYEMEQRYETQIATLTDRMHGYKHENELLIRDADARRCKRRWKRRMALLSIAMYLYWMCRYKGTGNMGVQRAIHTMYCQWKGKEETDYQIQ
eukprot:191585_1